VSNGLLDGPASYHACTVSDELTTLRGPAEEGTRPRRDTSEVGTNIGRYVVLGVAGRGASGVVYAAYDPELDRKVALKVLGPADDDVGGSTRAEVLHEARALAKLRDAHVVTVHDVGEHDSRVYVVMEFVDGHDLQGWLEAEKPGVAAVVRVMTQAARGLRAAHDEGIVHRDFKPANVLIDDESWALVADFGLARLVGRRDEDSSTERMTSGPPGTPAYLPVELYEGGEANVRSDVFAFCVTLWEALYGQRPWSVGTEMALVEAKRAGPPTFPARPRVPRRIRALLRAGLSPEPEQRPASMTEVLRALEPPNSRLPVMAVTGVVTIAIASAWALRQPDPCAAGSQRAGQTWSEQRQSDLRRRIGDDESWAFFSSQAQRHLEAWTAAYRDACEATHVRHEQSQQRLDRRMDCLARRLGQFETLVSELDPTSRPEVMRATRALATMTDRVATQIECDPEAVTVGAPGDDIAASIVADIDRSEVLESLARYDDAMALAKGATQRAETEGRDYLHTLGSYEVGRLLERTNDAEAALQRLSEVHHRAEAHGWNELAILAGIYVVYEYGAVFQRPEDALAWEPHVESVIERAGGADHHRAALLDNVGVALLYAQRPEDALEHHRRALELREAHPERWLGLVGTLGNLGVVYEETRRYDEAIAMQTRALALLQGQLGEGHPHTARVLDNLGTAYLRKGELRTAVEYFERALKTRRAVLGDDHRFVAMSRTHLAMAHLEAGEPEAALQQYDAALVIYEATLGADAMPTLQCHEGRAHALAALKRGDEARAEAERAIAGLQKRLDPDHPELRGLRAIVESAGASPGSPE
jgi:tetratricopeptide (TPR) repeat protein